MQLLQETESIREWANYAALLSDVSPSVCQECGQVVYRVAVIEDQNGRQRYVGLCGRHYLEIVRFGVTPSGNETKTIRHHEAI
jgi:hypothetical protein